MSPSLITIKIEIYIETVYITHIIRYDLKFVK
jgi:hypothetical protein